jgi:glycosyltransferase involved in cell wall biosynthesis
MSLSTADKPINFIILNINVYSNYTSRHIAGAMRVKNIFDPMLTKPNVTVSNLVLLDVLELENNNNTSQQLPNVPCLSIGYLKITNIFSVFSFIAKGKKFIKAQQIKNATNVIYSYQYPDIRNIILILYAKYKGYKIVFDIVEDKTFQNTPGLNEKITNWLSVFFFKKMRWYANAVFAISSHLMQLVQQHSKNKFPIYSLPVSVNFKNFKPSQTVNNLPKKQIEIFYGGSFAAKDGLEYLIAAINIVCKKHPTIKLVLSGKGKPADVEKMCSELEDKSILDFKGFLSNEAYFNLLQQVDICCMTRNNSAFANAGFPFKLGEFLAAGKVIIATKVSDVEKYLVHQQSAMLVAPESVNEIVMALNNCIENIATLKNIMGKNATAVAKKYFDAEIGSQLVYQTALNF